MAQYIKKIPLFIFVIIFGITTNENEDVKLIEDILQTFDFQY
jgi:hypothetical protein